LSSQSLWAAHGRSVLRGRPLWPIGSCGAQRYLAESRQALPGQCVREQGGSFPSASVRPTRLSRRGAGGRSHLPQFLSFCFGVVVAAVVVQIAARRCCCSRRKVAIPTTVSLLHRHSFASTATHVRSLPAARCLRALVNTRPASTFASERHRDGNKICTAAAASQDRRYVARGVDRAARAWGPVGIGWWRKMRARGGGGHAAQDPNHERIVGACADGALEGSRDGNGVLPQQQETSPQQPPSRRAKRRRTSRTATNAALCALIASSLPSAMAASCISLSGSTACPGFNQSSISTDSTLVGLFPFLSNVTDVSSFDDSIATYISGDFTQLRYEVLPHFAD
jgi:hypothetical protein